MIAVTLGLFLLGGIIHVFIGSKQAFRTNEALSRVQESGRFALEFLATDIRMAGFQGCANLDSITPNIIASPPTGISFAIGDVIQGRDNVAAGTTVGSRAVLAGTDTVSIRFADPSSARLQGNMNAVNANVQLTHNAGAWQAGDVLFITDCETADIFRATNVSQGASGVTIAHSSSANTSNNLSKAYQDDAMVMSFRSHTYYVSNTGRTNTNGDAVIALYRDGDELVEGIRDLQVLYGVDNTGNLEVDAYVTASAISAANWPRVMAVRVCAIAVSSESRVSPTPMTVACHGVVPAAPNIPANQLGHAFTATIGLRNRLP